MCFQVPFTDLVDAAKCVVKALLIREKYINRSMQNFCKTAAHALQDLGTNSLDLRVYDDVPETPVDAGMLIKMTAKLSKINIIVLMFEGLDFSSTGSPVIQKVSSVLLMK